MMQSLHLKSMRRSALLVSQPLMMNYLWGLRIGWREGRVAQKISQFIERQFKRIGIRFRMNNFSARMENKLRKSKIKKYFF